MGACGRVALASFLDRLTDIVDVDLDIEQGAAILLQRLADLGPQ
jgi:hypothetical protein